MTIADPEDDEEQMEAELREHFPSYLHEDFGEFVHADLNEVVKPIQQRATTTTGGGKAVVEVITQDDYRLICSSFMATITSMTACYFHQGQVKSGGGRSFEMGLTAVDRQAAFGLRTEIFKRLFDQFKSTLSDAMDDAFYLGAAQMVDTIQKCYEETPIASATYDFYKDSNVQEVVACLDVLQEVRGRVQRELQQWPDHAVLNDVSGMTVVILFFFILFIHRLPRFQ